MGFIIKCCFKKLVGLALKIVNAHFVEILNCAWNILYCNKSKVVEVFISRTAKFLYGAAAGFLRELWHNAWPTCMISRQEH